MDGPVVDVREVAAMLEGRKTAESIIEMAAEEAEAIGKSRGREARDEFFLAIIQSLRDKCSEPVDQGRKPLYWNASVQIHNCEATEYLKSHQFAEDDCIVTDPPYGTGGWRNVGSKDAMESVIVRESWDVKNFAWIRECRGLPVIAFCPPQAVPLLLDEARVAGYAKFRAIYYRKTNPKPSVQGRTVCSVEPAWAISKTGFFLRGGADVYEGSPLREYRDKEFCGHPYQKPLGLMKWIIDKVAAGRVIDPFMGSGSTLEAARMCGRATIGIEIDRNWCDAAAKRLRRSTNTFCPLEQNNG